MKQEVLLERIREDFPKLTWNKFRYYGKGWDHDVIILDHKIVFRFPKEKDYLENFQREKKLIDYFSKKVSAKIPVFSYFPKDKSYYGYEIVQGKELRTHFYKNMDAKRKTICISKIAEFLTELHKIPKKVIDSLDFEYEDVGQKVVKRIKSGLIDLLPKRLSKSELSIIKRYLSEFENVLSEGFPNSLIHGDFVSDHILWDEKSKSINVIDFSDFAYYDPAFDFTKLYSYGPKFVREVYRKYEGVKDDNFLIRAKYYYLSLPIRHMIYAIYGNPNCNFEKSYDQFKKFFKLN